MGEKDSIMNASVSSIWLERDRTDCLYRKLVATQSNGPWELCRIRSSSSDFNAILDYFNINTYEVSDIREDFNDILVVIDTGLISIAELQDMLGIFNLEASVGGGVPCPTQSQIDIQGQIGAQKEIIKGFPRGCNRCDSSWRAACCWVLLGLCEGCRFGKEVKGMAERWFRRERRRQRGLLDHEGEHKVCFLRSHLQTWFTQLVVQLLRTYSITFKSATIQIVEVRLWMSNTLYSILLPTRIDIYIRLPPPGYAFISI